MRSLSVATGMFLNFTYNSKTKNRFKVRICEHLGISHLTGKKVKIDNIKLTAIQEHLL